MMGRNFMLEQQVDDCEFLEVSSVLMDGDFRLQQRTTAKNTKKHIRL